MPVNLYYTKRVRGFQQVSEKYSGEAATFLLRRTQQRCPRCGSTAVCCGDSASAMRGAVCGFKFTSCCMPASFSSATLPPTMLRSEQRLNVSAPPQYRISGFTGFAALALHVLDLIGSEFVLLHDQHRMVLRRFMPRLSVDQ